MKSMVMIVLTLLMLQSAFAAQDKTSAEVKKGQTQSYVNCMRGLFTLVNRTLDAQNPNVSKVMDLKRAFDESVRANRNADGTYLSDEDKIIVDEAELGIKKIKNFLVYRYRGGDMCGGMDKQCSGTLICESNRCVPPGKENLCPQCGGEDYTCPDELICENKACVLPPAQRAKMTPSRTPSPPTR